MTTMASQITSLTIVYSTVYSDADQRKHQSSASLAFVWGIHRDRWIPRTKGQLRGKFFHLMTSSWVNHIQYLPKISTTHGQKWPYLKMGFPPSPFWEEGDCSQPYLMAHRAAGHRWKYLVFGRRLETFNTLRPRQDGRHFPDDIFKCIFLNENV